MISKARVGWGGGGGGWMDGGGFVIPPSPTDLGRGIDTIWKGQGKIQDFIKEGCGSRVR